ncbi:hypothetical protein B9G55_14065 [Saccharibacillus sp. O16]|nr:hypothetical protein B9G55_14065 [Saccharibacillus sp. O16]
MIDPQQRVLHVNYKKLGLAAAIGLVIYFLFNFTTLFQSDMNQQESYALIDTKQAETTASAFASKQLGITESLGQASVAYRSDSNLYGYLSREKLLSEYDRTYLNDYPYEMFRVMYKYTADGVARDLRIDVGAKSGRVVAFNDLPVEFAEQLSDTAFAPPPLENGVLLLPQKEAIAEPALRALGLDPAKLELTTSEGSSGLRYQAPSIKIGDSNLEVNVTFEGDKVASVRPNFTIPSSYTDYIDKQTFWAGVLTYGGYLLLTLVLSILAIVFASILRRYTSFKRGIFLSLFYYVVSIFSVWNMRPYFESTSYSSLNFAFTLGIQIVVGLFMAAGVYFTFVGGDALWRSQGQNMWMRRGEAGYGKHVWEAAKTGYLWALILLAVQAVIFFVLERSLGVFYTTDDSQSTYNMMYPWLFPIMAWMAGISEEAIYRLFGIPMLKKLVRSTWVAAAITTLIWAFGHTLYSIYPVVTRPIELLFLGLIFSFIFLRYGYITAMFAHVVFDSILMGLSLIFMGTATYMAVGIVSIVLPAIVAFVIYMISRNDPVKPDKPSPQPVERLHTTESDGTTPPEIQPQNS